jgi:predicted nucleotidyltransferase component of viral defense system
MSSNRTEVVEQIQRMAVSLLATSPAGHRLCLIGGFRYRLLSQSCRASLDIDYHWDGDLDGKQTEIVDLLRAKLLPDVKRRMGYDGDVGKATGPDADSPSVKTAVMALCRAGETQARIEIPVEITSIPCMDSPVVRTVAGTVYLTASDADMIESKVIALFNRAFVEERDIVDLFLFQDQFVADSAERLKTKLAGLHVSPESVADRCARLLTNRAVHVRTINEIIEDQIDAAVAANLKASGGGGMVFDAVIAMLKETLRIAREAGQ